MGLQIYILNIPDVSAIVDVAEKPRIVESPKDIIANENTDVIFHCRATGDPEPTVIWKKLRGQIAPDRSSLCLSVCLSRYTLCIRSLSLTILFV